MVTLETWVSSTKGAVQMGASSFVITFETRESINDRFTVNKFHACSDARRDENNWPSGMETISRKAKVFEFLFGMFSFDNEEIYESIVNYDYVHMELRIFGTMVYLNLDLVSQATKIPRRGGDSFRYWKTPKLEKN